MNRVVLSGLEFHGRHGVHLEESKFGARFIVDAELFFDFAGLPDALEHTVDYGAVYRRIAAEVTEKRYNLIEFLASTLAEQLLAEHPRLERVRVRVHKPHAPLPGIFRDVYAEVERAR